jgi:dephospho-CoA kinase
VTSRKPILGLIGAIGAGKSTVAGVLAARGAAVINADAVGHDAIEQPGIRERVLERWPDVLKPDGRIDRRKVAAIVFASSVDRKFLESQLFPYIRQKCEEAIHAAQQEPAARFIVLDAAVMLEAGWHGICDKLIYVDAPRELRIQRLAARSGWTADELTAREAAQLPSPEKKKHATSIITNAGSRVELEAAIDQLLATWNIER